MIAVFVITILTQIRHNIYGVARIIQTKYHFLKCNLPYMLELALRLKQKQKQKPYNTAAIKRIKERSFQSSKRRMGEKETGVRLTSQLIFRALEIQSSIV